MPLTTGMLMAMIKKLEKRTVTLEQDIEEIKKQVREEDRTATTEI